MEYLIWGRGKQKAASTGVAMESLKGALKFEGLEFTRQRLLPHAPNGVVS